MAYNLTAQDLEKLAAMGINVNGVSAGAEATPEEMAALGVTDPTAIVPEQPSIPVTSPDDTSVKQAPAGPVKPLPDVQAPPATTATGSDMSGLLAMLTQQSQTPTDPYENLSKRQRMMLGFAAIQDAGQALLGKDGRAFERLMGRFNDMTDMERKRQAANAQRAMLGQIMGGQVGAGGDIESQIQALTQAAMMGLIDPSAASLAITQLREGKTKEAQTTSQVTGAGDALEQIERLRDFVTENEMTTGFMGWVARNFPSSKASSAKSIADTLRSSMALGALKDLKAAGGTLGSVSAPELELLESSIAQINLDVGEAEVLNQLSVIEGHYKRAIKKAYDKSTPDQKKEFDKFFGGKTPAWVLSDTAPAPTTTKTPTDDLTDAEKKALGLD